MKIRHLLLYVLILIVLPLLSYSQSFQPEERTRIIVLTDIENEPDDAQSLVRFLSYVNHFEFEGIIATTSIWLPNKTAEWRIYEILDAYKEVQPNLIIHEPGFPEYEELRSKVKKGLPVYGMQGVGEGKDSEGSDWIIQILKNGDPRPLWVLAWGGPNCLAQALWKLQNTVSKEKLKEYIKKLRVYTISDQDDSGPWMRKTFPDLFYICTPGYAHNGKEGYHFATWSGISGDTFHGRFQGANREVIGASWIKENIQENHGPLGEQYPDVEYLMEGDTPSFLYLIANGLGSPENPNYGSWGGRYELYTPPTQKYYFEPETRPIWTNANDEVFSPIIDQYVTGNHATIWRWREDFQNDFAARMDWCLKPYKEANHPPIPALEHDEILEVNPGDEVKLIGSGTDPDGDELSFKWVYYREVGNSVYWLELENANSKVAGFKAPDLGYPQELHFILSVTDKGNPAMIRYKRVIIKVND